MRHVEWLTREVLIIRIDEVDAVTKSCRIVESSGQVGNCELDVNIVECDMVIGSIDGGESIGDVEFGI